MQRLTALAFVLTAIVFSAPASAYTQEQQLACQDDAFRFCALAIPDEERIKVCLIRNLRQLSPACRRMFMTGKR